MPGFVAERCRWQMQRGEDGTAVKIWRNTAIFRAPQEGLRSNFKSVCISSLILWGQLSLLFYGDFTCFSLIDKTTAHGFFRTPLFIFKLFFVHFVPHNPRNPFGTSSKKHQSQFKPICNAHQHIRISFDIIHFGYF